MPSPFRRCRQTAPPMGTTRWENAISPKRSPSGKRNSAPNVTTASLLVPHSLAYSKVVPPEAMENAPASLHSLDVKSRYGQKYVLQVARKIAPVVTCASVAQQERPSQNPEIKAINMMSRLEHVEGRKINYDFFLNQKSIVANWNVLIFVHRSRNYRCLNIQVFALAGETPYIKLLTSSMAIGC